MAQHTEITVKLNDMSLTKNVKKPILKVWLERCIILRVWQIDNFANAMTMLVNGR